MHSDVGAGYQESESQLSQLALRWMLCEAERALLAINPHRRDAVLGGQAPYVKPDATTTNQHESLKGAWWIAELWPKIVHRMNAQGTWRRSISMNLGRRRLIPPNPTVHESVQLRLATVGANYRPSNLPDGYSIATDNCTSNGI